MNRTNGNNFQIECEVVLNSKPVEEPKLIDINVDEYKTKADVSVKQKNIFLNNSMGDKRFIYSFQL